MLSEPMTNLTRELVFESIREGTMSFSEFDDWLSDRLEESRLDGAESEYWNHHFSETHND